MHTCSIQLSEWCGFYENNYRLACASLVCNYGYIGRNKYSDSSISEAHRNEKARCSVAPGTNHTTFSLQKLTVRIRLSQNNFLYFRVAFVDGRKCTRDKSEATCTKEKTITRERMECIGCVLVDYEENSMSRTQSING